ncbi:hypothetical protein HDU76_000234 [Blyttiomyces sp. JEL0837]|nr:hypothetical protein HDU76_000234 [Blyttiomyces sp. JEL0837]
MYPGSPLSKTLQYGHVVSNNLFVLLMFLEREQEALQLITILLRISHVPMLALIQTHLPSTTTTITAAAVFLLLLTLLIRCQVRRKRQNQNSIKPRDIESGTTTTTEANSKLLDTQEDNSNLSSNQRIKNDTKSKNRESRIKINDQRQNDIDQSNVVQLDVVVEAIRPERTDSSHASGTVVGAKRPRMSGKPMRSVKAFVGQNEDEIGIKVGDPLSFYQIYMDGWAYGMNWRTGLSGFFPANVVPQNDETAKFDSLVRPTKS